VKTPFPRASLSTTNPSRRGLGLNLGLYFAMPATKYLKHGTPFEASICNLFNGCHRIPVGARFSAPVQTGPGAHSSPYTMNTESFPGVKRPGRGVDHPPHQGPRLKKE